MQPLELCHAGLHRMVKRRCCWLKTIWWTLSLQVLQDMAMPRPDIDNIQDSCQHIHTSFLYTHTPNYRCSQKWTILNILSPPVGSTAAVVVLSSRFKKDRMPCHDAEAFEVLPGVCADLLITKTLQITHTFWALLFAGDASKGICKCFSFPLPHCVCVPVCAHVCGLWVIVRGH